MKKIALSLLVIVLLLSFVFYKKFEDSKSLAVSQDYSDENPPKNIPPIVSSTTLKPRPEKGYRDGEYVGGVVDAFFGDMQAKAVVKNGKIVDVIFLKYPNDRATTIQINEDVIPILREEVIKAQSAQVDIVTGATQSVEAFRFSLQSALDQAEL